MKNKNFIRIIPKLDIKNGMLIKGINLEGLRVLGDPFNFARYYYENLADEICYIDNVATLYGTNNLSNFISDFVLDLSFELPDVVFLMYRACIDVFTLLLTFPISVKFGNIFDDHFDLVHLFGS